MSYTPTVLLDSDEERTTLDRHRRPPQDRTPACRYAVGPEAPDGPRPKHRVAVLELLLARSRHHPNATGFVVLVGLLLGSSYLQQRQIERLRASIQTPPATARSSPPVAGSGRPAPNEPGSATASPSTRDPRWAPPVDRAESESRAFSFLVANRPDAALEVYESLADAYPEARVYARFVSVLRNIPSCGPSDSGRAGACVP